MKIEKFSKNKDKYRVLLSTGEVIDIYDEVIIKYNLLYKKELTEELLNEIKEFNNYISAYNDAMKYLSIRLRAESEISNYLIKKKYDTKIIDYVIDRLKKNCLINDLVFSKAFIHDKLEFTSVGKYKIKEELNRLKINRETISNVLEDIDEELWNERINNLINKYLKKKTKYSGNVLKNKIYIYLVNLGYDKSLVINNLSNYDF